MSDDAIELVDHDLYWIVYVSGGDERHLELARWVAKSNCFAMVNGPYWAKLKNVLQVVSKLERPAMPECFN